MTFGRLEVSGGAALVWALLYWLDEDGAAVWVLSGCLCHELGHWLAIHALGGRVSRIRLTCAGVEMRLSRLHPLSPGRMLLAALAGPGANLLLALASIALARRGAGEKLYFWAGIHLGLAAFNLLPAGWLDGGRAIRELLALLGLEEQGRRATDLCAEGTAALLLALGAVLLWHSGGRNFTLLLAGLWMLWQARQEREGALC